MKLSSTLPRAFILIFVFSLAIFAQNPTGRDKGIELFKQGNYKAAIKTLKDFTKENSTDYLALHYLALALTRENKLKDAEKAYEKAIQANPNFADSQIGLAYIYLRRDKLAEAAAFAEKSIALDGKNAEAFYVLGSANLRLGKADAAIENAERGIKLNPNLAGLYQLHAQAVVSSNFAGKTLAQKGLQYGSASQSLEKFIKFSANLPAADAEFWRAQQKALEFYAGYYAEVEKNHEARKNSPKTPVKILTKPRANYTPEAQSADVRGIVRLLATFGEDGKVRHILVTSGLGYGLDQQATIAAQNIKFEPQTVDGKPVPVAKTIEYNFTLP